MLFSDKHTEELVSAHLGKEAQSGTTGPVHTWNTNFLQAVYFIMKTVIPVKLWVKAMQRLKWCSSHYSVER